MKLDFPRGLVLVASLLIAGPSLLAQEKNPPLVLRGGTLIDGTGSSPQPQAIILVRNGKIEAIGKNLDTPSNAKTMDLEGKFIIPALVDSRVRIGPTPANHILRSEVGPEQRLESLKALLASGVSTARLLQGDLAEQQVYQRWWEDNLLVSPRVFTSGPVFTSKFGHPVEEYSIPATSIRDRELRQITSEDQARDFAREVAHGGANSFEINADQGPPTAKRERLQKPLLEILVSEAHGHDLPVYCEVGWNQEVLDAISVGVNTVEGIWEESLSGEAARALAKGKVTFIPALTQQGDLLNLLSEPALKAYLAEPLVQQSLSTTMKQSLASNAGMLQRLRETLNGESGESIRRQLQEQQKRAFGNVQMAKAAGVKIALGTGAGNLLIFPGASVHRELQLLVAAGLTPMEALVAGTRNSAESLGLGSELGTLEPGKSADFLILDADPLVDIQNTQKIYAVIQRGHEISSQELQIH